jgi:hypothetical protein
MPPSLEHVCRGINEREARGEAGNNVVGIKEN